jgi:hypothetical protein
MDTESIAVHRVAIVIPFAQFLEDIGAPTQRGCGQAGLPWGALESADNYVPSHNHVRPPPIVSPSLRYLSISLRKVTFNYKKHSDHFAPISAS